MTSGLSCQGGESAGYWFPLWFEVHRADPFAWMIIGPAIDHMINVKYTEKGIIYTLTVIARINPTSSRSAASTSGSWISGWAGSKYSDLLYVAIIACVARLITCARHLDKHEQCNLQQLNVIPYVKLDPSPSWLAVLAHQRVVDEKFKVAEHSNIVRSIIACYPADLVV